MIDTDIILQWILLIFMTLCCLGSGAGAVLLLSNRQLPNAIGLGALMMVLTIASGLIILILWLALVGYYLAVV